MFIPLTSTIAYGSEALKPSISIPTSLHDRWDVLSIKRAVIAEYGLTSPMVRIAMCESTFRQYGTDDQVLRGIVNSDDVGIFQLNEYYHLDKANELGFDIYTVDGNIKMARYLYDKYGTQPWSASKTCWNN